MLAWRWLIGLVLVGTAGSACGRTGLDSGRPDGPVASAGPGRPVPFASFEQTAMAATCGYEARCGYVPDVATCEASWLWRSPQTAADVQAGKILYDGSAAAECFAAIGSVGCDMTDTFTSGLPSCQSMFKGVLAEGATCFAHAECASGGCTTQYCPSAPDCCRGTCDPLPVPSLVRLGGDCSAYFSVCAEKSYCDWTQTPPICAPASAPGQACDPSATGACLEQTICLMNAEGTWGTCGYPPAEGEACIQSPLGCNSYRDICDPATSRCVRRRSPGQSCPVGFECVDYATCISGTCVALKQAGERCAAGPDAVPCLGDLVCADGICALPRPAPVCN